MMELPALTAEIDAALRQSIEDYGVIVPVVYNRGELIDGHNRTRIGTELGVPIPRIDLDIEQDHADRIAVELNTARRQMTTQVRRQIVKKLIEAGYTQRVVAAAVGAPKSTISDDVKASSARNRAQDLSSVKEAGGRSRAPATRKKPALPAPNSGRAKTVGGAMNDKLQVFIGQMTGGLRYFEEKDLAILGAVLSEEEIKRLVKDMKTLSASCRRIANNLQEVQSHAS